MKKQLLSLLLVVSTGTALADVGDLKLKEVWKSAKPWTKIIFGFGSFIAHGVLLYEASDEKNVSAGLDYWLKSTIFPDKNGGNTFGSRLGHSATIAFPTAASFYLIKSGIDDLRKK